MDPRATIKRKSREMRAQCNTTPFRSIRSNAASMGDTGSELLPDSLCFRAIADLGEAECEAFSNDAALRSVVQAWSTLDQPIREAIALLVKSRPSSCR